MTLKKIIEQNNFIQYNPSYQLKSQIDFTKLIKKYKYIEVAEFWYDDENDPELNTWLNIEGIGYGWLWASNRIRKKFKMLQRIAVRKFAIEIMKAQNNDTEVITFSHNGAFIIGFVSDDCYIQITLANEEFL